jgi:hypothetical protein
MPLCILEEHNYHRHSSRNDQQYALIFTSPLFYILAPTCFDSILPSSGSFLDPSELLEIQIKWVVYHIMCGYMVCVSDCHGSICCAYQLGRSTDGTPGWVPGPVWAVAENLAPHQDTIPGPSSL